MSSNKMKELHNHKQDRELFHPSPKGLSFAASSSPPSQPGETMDLFSAQIDSSSPGSHISGIIQYVAYCIWLLSLGLMLLRFLQVAMSVNISFL